MPDKYQKAKQEGFKQKKQQIIEQRRSESVIPSESVPSVANPIVHETPPEGMGKKEYWFLRHEMGHSQEEIYAQHNKTKQY